MKRILTILFVLIVVCCFAFIGCGKTTDTQNDKEEEMQKIEISVKNLDLTVGEHSILEVFTELDGNVSWKSSNESVASVDDNGKVTAIAVGEAEIIASISEYSAKCNVVVKKEEFSIHFDNLDPTIKIGEEYKLNVYCISGDGLSVGLTFDNSDLLEVVSKDNAVINGKCEITLKALKLGETNVSITIGEAVAQLTIKTENSYSLKLSGVKGNVKFLDVGKEYELDYSYLLNGEIGSFNDISWKISDETVATITDNKIKLSNKSGAFVVTATVGDKTETYNAISYKAISTKDELNAIQNDLSGCYYLKNDIDFGGAVLTTIAPYSDTGASKETSYMPQRNTFEGVLDGNGYAIKNYTPKASPNTNTQNAIFGVIGENGIVKNISLLNVKGYLGGSALAYFNFGLISDVYLEMSIVGTTTAINKNNPFAGLVTKMYLNAKVENCISIVDFAVKDNKGNVINYSTTTNDMSERYGLIAGYVASTVQISNCYAYSNFDVIELATQPQNEKGITKSYKYNNFEIFNGDFSNYSDDLWNKENGKLPILKNNHLEHNLSIGEIEFVKGMLSIDLSSLVTASGLYVIKLDTANNDITLANGKMLNIDGIVQNGSTFTLTIKVLGDSSIQKVFNGLISETEELRNSEYYDLSEDKMIATLQNIDLSKLQNVSIDGQSVDKSSIIVDGQVLTISNIKSAIYTGLNDLGNKTIVVTTTEKNYSFNMVVVSKIIRQKDIVDGNPASLDEIFYSDEYKVVDGSITNWNGYFVLGEDIEFNSTKAHTTPSVLTSTNFRFNGAFDGLGHKISNYAIGKTGGMFTCLGVNAVIKNVYFDKPQFKSYQGHGFLAGVSYKGSVIENVLLDVDYQTNESSSSHQLYTNGLLVRENNGSIKNCVVIVTDSSTTSIKHGYLVSKNNGTMENCYVIATLSGEATTFADIIATSQTSTGTHTTCKLIKNTENNGLTDFYNEIDIQTAIENFSTYWNFDSTNKAIEMTKEKDI